MGAEDNEDEVKSEGVLECLPNSIEESENIIFGQLEPDVKVCAVIVQWWYAKLTLIYRSIHQEPAIGKVSSRLRTLYPYLTSRTAMRTWHI